MKLYFAFLPDVFSVKSFKAATLQSSKRLRSVYLRISSQNKFIELPGWSKCTKWQCEVRACTCDQWWLVMIQDGRFKNLTSNNSSPYETVRVERCIIPQGLTYGIIRTTWANCYTRTATFVIAKFGQSTFQFVLKIRWQMILHSVQMFLLDHCW